ncbi:MAG: glycosyltransferase [Clostridia bacterium]|nr:glycosyltransferase [Clostridia bacterium]
MKDVLNSIMVIVPSLDPDEKLIQVIEGMQSIGFSNILLIDDGSQSEHTQAFRDAEKHLGCKVLVHEKNLGKGRALKTAFSYVLQNRPDISGVVTIDGDNQHKPKDAQKIALALLDSPDTVMLGVRNFKQNHVPLHNRLGNTLTSVVFKLLCGIKLSDTQTGLRGVSVKFLSDFIALEGERFEYETNMLLYMKKAGIPFREIAIETVYIEGNITSHFNPFTDSAKIYGPILKFASGSILSALIDLGIFTLLVWAMDHVRLDRQIFIATIAARVVSSLFNYAFNRRAVFESDEPKRITLLRYYFLCIFQMLVSYKSVEWLIRLFALQGFEKTLSKLLIDSILFVLTFQIQREWVFKKKKLGINKVSGE